MNIQIILIIIGLVIVFFLAFKIFRKIIKAAITVFILFLVILGVAGVIIYNDAMTIKKGFEGEQTIVITNDQELITAFKTAELRITSIRNQEFYEVLTLEEMQEIAKKLADEEYEEIEKENFLVIIEQKAFYEEETTILGIETTTTKEALERLSASTSTEEAIAALSMMQGINQEDTEIISNKEIHEIKTQIYYELFLNQIKETRGTFILKGIRNKEINTHPKLLSVTIFNIFPESIMERMTKEE